MIEINKYSVISFDIFDTLLLRPYTDPQEVWKVIEEQEKVTGFAKARKEADAQTYRECISRGGETTLEAAYDLIPQWKYMMQKEMDMERKVLCVNPEMKALWDCCKAERKKCVIVSDMYLPGFFLKSVLEEKGIYGWDGFYLSCDYDCRKSSGKLFEVMLKEMNARPEDVLHIGDNRDSDVEQPMKLGIKAEYYRKISDRFFDICPYGRSINRRLAGALALGWHMYSFAHPNATYWNRLGFIIGGVLGYMYVKWIVEIARQRGITKLLFVARDGYILRKICDELFTDIQTEYVYAPRLTSIAVNGAIGSDPWAIEDRQRYIDNHLKGVDTDAIKQEYFNYISTLNIDDHTALVDGCSSGFSAQNLIETCLGKHVFSFYLLAMAEMHNAAALYQTNLYSPPFHMLSEFIFGAPTPPIISVVDCLPKYNEEVSENEFFKISISEEIAIGALACARVLCKNGVSVSPNEWQDYADSFMSNLTEEDRGQLSNATNAADVEQKAFHGVMWVPLSKRRFSCSRFGRFSLRFVYRRDVTLYQVELSPRRRSYSKKNIGVTYSVVVP